MSQGSSSNPSPSDDRVTYTEPKPVDDREGLLRQVIETTFSGASHDLSQQEWDSLRQVAVEHAKSPVLDLAITVQLVKSLIETRFASLAQDKPFLEKISLRISGTLLSHPASQIRMRRFWELLLSERS